MDSKQKIYLTSGIILIFIILTSHFLIGPLVKEIKEYAMMTATENIRLQYLKNFDINRTAELESDYKSARDNLSLFKIDLNEKQSIDFIVALEKEANNSLNNLEIKSAEFPNFTLYLTGDFPSLMKFLGWLENNPYLISIQSLNIGKLSESALIRTILEIKLPLNKPGKNESEKSI